MDFIADWWEVVAAWWVAHAVAISITELGILIVGSIMGSLIAWKRERSLKARIDELENKILREFRRQNSAAVETDPDKAAAKLGFHKAKPVAFGFAAPRPVGEVKKDSENT